MEMRAPIEFRSNTTGASAVEFAIIAPIFLAMIFGVMQSGLLLFTISSLRYATESAARCASVNSSQCSDTATISNYAEGAYYAIGSKPIFTSGTAACGKLVSGSVTFDLNVIIYQTDVPLTSSACFP
jgi:Flp pilus assembly protein TadG